MSKKILIGSSAIKHYFPDFRDPKDTDYLVDEYQRLTPESYGIEHFNANRGKGLRRLFDESHEVVTPQQSLTLKLSHSYWAINWQKHMSDILFLQKAGVESDLELYNLLVEDWKEIHGKKRANLNKTNEEFFSDKVDRKYVHDDLHAAIAYYDRPLYERCKKDLSRAQIEYKLFLGLSVEDQLRLCREEIYVTALERFMIPRNFRISRLHAYRLACEQLVCSMTKGWFPEYIVFNWQILNKPDDHDFVGLFKRKFNED